MLTSDETHLTSFGDAQAWPAYLHFGNEPKERRSRTSLKLFEEIAYFQKVRLSSPITLKLVTHLYKLPDSFSDWYLQHSGKTTVSDETMRHVRREAFQEQWATLLDDEFVYAYEHGLVVDNADGTQGRFYPRLLTYAADYPERCVTFANMPSSCLFLITHGL
jgi:hypothetical protein